MNPAPVPVPVPVLSDDGKITDYKVSRFAWRHLLTRNGKFSGKGRRHEWKNITLNIRDFRLLPQSRLELQSSGLLLSE